MTLLPIFSFLLVSFTICTNPELFNLSTKNQCIKDIVSTFLTSNTCLKLSQNQKTELAIKMTNCLFKQMGKSEVSCISRNQCNLNGDSWNTFTTFFAHIDNLCHFYWEVSKAQRTQHMIDALINSAQNTQKTLSENNENTKQIIQLQNSLKIQILSSIATQQQMSQIISNSSLAINSLTSQITSSLNKIHKDIDQHYAVVTRILSAVNQVINHLDSLKMYLVAEVCSIQGVLFFVALAVLIFIGSILSQKARIRKNECLMLICTHFLVEFFFSNRIQAIIGIQFMRFICILLIFVLILTVRQPKNKVQLILSNQLNSERMNRLMQKALKRHLNQLILQKNTETNSVSINSP